MAQNEVQNTPVESSDAPDIPSQAGNTATQVEAGKELSERAEQRHQMAEQAATKEITQMVDNARAMANAAAQGWVPDVSSYSDGRISDVMPDSFESAEEASKFVTEEAEAQATLKEDLANERAKQAQQQAEQQPQEQAQPDAWDVPGEDGLTPRTRQAFAENPQLAQTVEAMNATVEQAATNYAQSAGLAVQQSEALLLAEFPEVVSVPAEHRASVLQAMQVNNPERYQQFAARYQQLQQAGENYAAIANQLTAARQQQYQQQFSQWAQAEDAKFEQSIKGMPAQERQAVADMAKQLLLDTGLSENDVSAMWESHPFLRSAGTQAILLDAARYRLAQKGIQADRQAKRGRVPPVQKPGTNIPRSRTTPRMAELESKGSLSVREAAELVSLQARRRAS
jgi:hypothetical protein